MSANKIDGASEPEQASGKFYGRVIGRRRSTGLSLTELKHNVGRRLPKHSHEFAYFCLLLNGAYYEYYGRKSFIYKPMTIMFHPPDITHQDEVGSQGGHFFSIELDSPWMERMGEYHGIPRSITDIGHTDAAWLGMRLYREFREHDSYSELAIEGLVMAMMAELCRSQTKSERRRPAWLRRAIDLMTTDFQRKLTLTQIAAEVGVHPFHLSKVFRQFHHQTVGDYVNRLRVQFACAYLPEVDRPLSEISLEAGFADQSHFTRVFKQVTGLTPGAYRLTLSHDR
jgi:AraC family transcriptional regulator